MQLVIFYLAVFALTLGALVAIEKRNAKAQARRAAELAAIRAAASRKHVRITHWYRHVDVTYYDAAGRRVTKRKGIAYRDLGRIIASAKARGYRCI